MKSIFQNIWCPLHEEWHEKRCVLLKESKSPYLMIYYVAMHVIVDRDSKMYVVEVDKKK